MDDLDREASIKKIIDVIMSGKIVGWRSYKNIVGQKALAEEISKRVDITKFVDSAAKYCDDEILFEKDRHEKKLYYMRQYSDYITKLSRSLHLGQKKDVKLALKRVLQLGQKLHEQISAL